MMVEGILQCPLQTGQYICKNCNKTLITWVFYFPIQAAVPHTFFLNCIRFYYFVVIISKIHATP